MSAWPLCTHGYNITPSHKCPWCFDGDTSAFRHVVGEGNDWLLGKDDYACDGCGGPRGAGWGAWSGPDQPTPERVREQLSTMRFCYSCVRDGKAMQRTSKRGELLTADEERPFRGGSCPDCGKRFIDDALRLTQFRACPRLTCGSRFLCMPDRVERTTDAHPDEPPPKTVTVSQ